MPSNSFHYHFGNVLYSKTSSAIQNQIDVDKPAFYFGNQGPDILFYIKLIRGVYNSLGTSVHTSFKTQEFLEASAKYIEHTQDNSILPYTYGMLCHYALDKNVHPFVYFREKDNPKFCDKKLEMFYHVDFESAMDFVCIEEYMGFESATYDSTRHLTISQETAVEIANFYETVFAPIYDPTLNSNDLLKCIKYMRRALKLFDDKKGRKLKLFKLLEKIPKFPGYPRAALRPTTLYLEPDYMNRNRSPYPEYRNHPEKTICITVDEMFNNGIIDALSLVEAFYDRITANIPLNADLFKVNFAGDLITNEF
ncbi:MAG: zinc dependent phospholipase C family protein [Christensenellaceae bacterium]|jgi:hypothetical protein|nr:zinc dependent phospholipase C family protein [Christensenellaceae bacterium]